MPITARGSREHREELAIARRARRLFPNSVRREVLALAALGRTDEVQALLEEDQRIFTARNAAGELLVHDHLDAASQVLDQGITRVHAWLSTAPTETASTEIGWRISDLADMLVLRGRVDEARVVLERALAEERADSPSRRRMFIGTLGVIAGMQGDRQRALEIAQDLEAQPWRRQTEQALWQARIAASLGELDEATAILREGVREGLQAMDLRHQPSVFWGALWDHPPFQELIRPKG